MVFVERFAIDLDSVIWVELGKELPHSVASEEFSET
jgi:hypothetical protein